MTTVSKPKRKPAKAATKDQYKTCFIVKKVFIVNVLFLT
jgi:hypothetical protein